MKSALSAVFGVVTGAEVVGAAVVVGVTVVVGAAVITECGRGGSFRCVERKFGNAHVVR